MKLYHFSTVAFCATILACVSPAKADFIASGSLDAAQDLDPLTNMPPISPATGSFSVTFSSGNNDLSYSLSYSGLISSATMAHIHFGPPGVTGAPIFTLFDFGVPPSISKISDTMTGTLTPANFMPDAADGVTTFAQAITDLEAGSTYVNVHSTNYPAGEIRGQIIPSDGTAVPEPASTTLLGLTALIGITWRLRRSAALLLLMLKSM